MDEGTPAPPHVPGYEVLEVLGQGASATVWRARRVGDGLTVALKVIRPAGGDVAAGLREAGLLAGVRHPHVVSLHDVLPLPDPVTGRPASVALATQLAGGGSLAQVLSRRRMLSPGELVTALQPVAGAVADLHRQGIVHGDISTGNVLLTRDGRPLLSDLGAARVAGAPAGDPQGTGAASGLVAPEVVEGFPPTQESDVYQLGAVGWLCLAGRPPGPSWARQPLDEVAPGLPGGLAALVTRCLAPEPGDRPDAEELALALLATAVPEPLEVAPDADPGHGLTERLRQLAREDAPPEGAGARGRWAGVRRLAAHRPGSHRPARAPGGAGAARGALVAAAAVLALAGGAVAVVVSPPSTWGGGSVTSPDTWGGGSVIPPDTSGGGSATPPDTSGGGSVIPPDTSGGGPVIPPDTSDGGPAAPPDTSGGGPVTSPDTSGGGVEEATVVLQPLVDGRAAAWESGDVAELEKVLAPGSPALESDAEALTRASARGVRFDDVVFTVEKATVVGLEEDRRTVEATVRREALTGTAQSGEVLVEQPAQTDEVRLVLVPGSKNQPWLLWSWGPG